MTSKDAAGQEDAYDDPIVKAIEKSHIARTIQAARASLAKPSRPYTPEVRSLFAQQAEAGSSRPSSGYTVDQIRFVKDTFSSTRSSLRSSSGERPETIKEEGAQDVLQLDDDNRVTNEYHGVPSPDDDSAFGDSSDEGGGPASPESPDQEGDVPVKFQPAATEASGAGGYPQARPSGVPPKPPGATGSSAKAGEVPCMRPKKRADEAVGERAATPRSRDWDSQFDTVVSRLQGLAESEERNQTSAELLAQMSHRIYDLVQDLKDGKSSKKDAQSEKLLRAVLAMLDLKETKCIFRLARSAFELMRMEGAVRSVSTSGVRAAYLNIAKVLFKCSKREEHDAEFLQEKLIDPLLEVLQWREEPHPQADELRVFAVGVIKNISHSDANQKYLAQQGAIGVLIENAKRSDLVGTSREAQVLIQITATLRNMANSPHHHRQFLAFDVLSALTRLSSLFPGQLELLMNISRILSKLSLHSAPCEALVKTDAHMRQIVRCMGTNSDHAPLVLRFAFVLGNLTAKSDKTRIVLMFDCEGSSLLPSLLTKYWKKDRQLAQVELEKGSGKSSAALEIEDVLVKLVRLVANVSISSSIGTITAASSAVVDPLLDMLGCKRITESEELVLNVVAAITNLLFYDAPANLLFDEENKQLLCRLFRPLLLESYNSEALMETARALGNLSRHLDARVLIRELRIDEILVILLDHDYRDLVFYICGVLVNLASDSECLERLIRRCKLVPKLAQLLQDAPRDDPELRLCCVKVLTNLTLENGMDWEADIQSSVKEALTEAVQICEQTRTSAAEGDATGQLLELSRNLLERVPEIVFSCSMPGCGRRFANEEKLLEHIERRHPELLPDEEESDGK